MSTAASNDPAVVVAAKLLSERCEAPRKRTDFFHRQTHRLASMDADTWALPLLHGVGVGGEALGGELLRDSLGARLIRQCQEEIQLMRLKRIEPPLAQLPDEFGVKVLAPLGASPAHGEVDAQGCEREGCKDQCHQPLQFEVPRTPRPRTLHSSTGGVEGAVVHP